jgi:hypothetical protein
MYLPFPHREDLPKWSEYVHRLSAAFKDRLGLKEPDEWDDTHEVSWNQSREGSSATR